MDRQASYISDRTHSRQPRPILPPWDVRNVTQVPFIEPGSPPFAKTVQRDAQGFFPSCTNAQHGHRPKLSTTVSAPCGSQYSSPISEESSSNPWKSNGPVPATAFLPPPPYETQTYNIPPGSKSASTVPTWAIQAPPTPPESVTKSPPRSLSASPPVRQVTKALPGTMSSRESRDKGVPRTRAKSHNREGRSSRSHSQPLLRDEPQKAFGARLKSALKDMFKREPVDEDQFEKIPSRHWTDEY